MFLGSIASANTLLKNPTKRDELRNKFGTKAVEMEGSGIADAGWSLDVGYLVIRGICDYCDSYKNDVWQSYAAAVAAAYTRVLIESIPCFDPLSIPSPHDDQDGIDPRYHPILKAFRNGSVVPILGAGINPEIITNLALHLADEIKEDFKIQGKWSSENDLVQEKELIRKLVGSPCSICHYLLNDRPDLCPMQEGIQKDCPLYQEQQLATIKTNLRCLLSRYVKSDQDSIAFYNNLQACIENAQNSNSEGLHQFIACEFPALMASKHYPSGHPGFPYQLIITTNYDNSLENAFKRANKEFDVVYYIAEGEERGRFKHKPFNGEERLIDSEYREFYLAKEFGGTALSPQTIILKLFGSKDDYFAITEEQLRYLANVGIKTLPSVLARIIKRCSLLFLGYSLKDFDLQIVLELLSIVLDKALPDHMWIVHQSQPGELEQKFLGKRERALLEGSPEDLIINLRKGLR